MYGVSFHRLAERELNEAAAFYEQESPGLGVSFLDEVEQYIEAIANHPSAGTRLRGQVRRRILHRFPYGILYSEKRDGIRILAIMNLNVGPHTGWAAPEDGNSSISTGWRASVSTLGWWDLPLGQRSPEQFDRGVALRHPVQR